MVVTFLKILVALYGAEKLIAAKDPARSFFDKIDFSANRFLVSLKNEEAKAVLLKTSRSLFIFNALLFLIFIIGAFVFKPLPRDFILNWSVLFISTVLLNIAIPWNLDHIGFIKRFFIGSPLMLIPVAPILSLALGAFYQIDMLDIFTTIPQGKELLEYFNGNRLYFAASLSGILFILYVVIPYIQFWVICFPIFYVFLISVKLMQTVLHTIHSKLNENILAVIMGVLAVILAGM